MADDNQVAAGSDDQRAALVALRDTLAHKLDTVEANVHAQLAAQYRATLADIAALDAERAELESDGLGAVADDEPFSPS